MSVVLGVNGFPGIGHDAAAALVVDGRLVVAVEEERLARVKRAYGLPPLRAMREALDVAKIRAADVDLVTYPWLPGAMGVAEAELENQILGWFGQAGLQVSKEVEICFVEHHVAHAWSGMAFVPGGISGRRLGILVLDGTGESTAGACYLYDRELTRKWSLTQTSSLGIYYEALSQYLGFRWGEEGKTMGLASYGHDFEVTVPSLPDNRFDGPPVTERDAVSPRHIHERVRESFIQDFRRLHGDHLPFNRRADVALAAQQAVADRVLMYVSELIDEIDVLSLSGGLALNCAVNSQVAALCRARGVDFTVPPPASDTGVALGSALFGSAEIDSVDSVLTIADPFLGRMFEPQAIARELHDQAAPVEAIDMNELVVELLERSAISGWFEGRAEVGPRALGKRSIIARPDSTAVRDRINVLKGRERWRPLAPSLTPNEFNRAFPGATPSPHMLIAASAAPEAAEALQGVVHVDGTSRPQVVDGPGIYRDLLMSAGTASGAEALICTSFNRAGEPMVYTPVEALRSAQEMGLDLLAGDGWCVRLHSRRPRNFAADVSRRGGRAAKGATRQTPVESAEHPT